MDAIFRRLGERVDAVVAADGMRSQTRDMLFDFQPRYETGCEWGCGGRISRIGPPRPSPNTGASGASPASLPPRNASAPCCRAAALLNQHVVDGEGRRVREQFSSLGGEAAELVETFPDETEGLFYRDLSDHRSRVWHNSRVVLLGDSACSFLLAAESALHGARVRRRARGRTLPHECPLPSRGVHIYEKRRKARSEAAQDDSHKLAAWLSTSSAALA